MSEELKSGYDEISPITGNFCVLVEEIQNEETGKYLKYKLCMESGFQTYAGMWNNDNPKELRLVEEQLPSFAKDKKVKDKNGDYWFPFTTMNYFAVIHNIIEENGDFKWVVSSMELATKDDDISKEMIVKLPIQFEDKIQMGLFKVNIGDIGKWDEFEFEEAFNVYTSYSSTEMSKYDEEE